MLRASALVVCALVPLSGCTSPDPIIPTGTSATASAPLARFPISVTRVGGVEGYDDSLTIHGSGEVEAVSKGVTTSCRLDPRTLSLLVSAASSITDKDSPTVTVRPDGKQLNVILGAGAAGTLGMDDPRVSAAKPLVNRLLDDVTGNAADRKICT